MCPRSVSEVIKEDTLLVVMGDHGMTSSGDHGGETQAEVEAALFLHSKSSLKPGSMLGNIRDSSQRRRDALIDWEAVNNRLLGTSSDGEHGTVSFLY